MGYTTLFFIYFLLTVGVLIIWATGLLGRVGRWLTKVLRNHNTTCNQGFLWQVMEPDRALGAKLKALYALCQRYSSQEALIVEPSIKISKGRVNQQRMTIPILWANFAKGDPMSLSAFCKALCDLVWGKEEEARGLSSHLATCLGLMGQETGASKGDLIVGYDWPEGKFKIYVDRVNQGIECLEFNLGDKGLTRKVYTLIDPKAYEAMIMGFEPETQALLELIGLGSARDCRPIYRADQGTYHMVLARPRELRIRDIQELSRYFSVGTGLRSWFDRLAKCPYRVHVISFKATRSGRRLKELSIYVRPKKSGIIEFGETVGSWARAFKSDSRNSRPHV